ncbi:MAG: YdcF family protein [Hyphomicrobiaceae bacterium]
MKLLKWTAGLTGLAAVLFAGGFLAFVYSIDHEPPGSSISADGIVVLTGGTERISEGLKLLADHRGGRLLISGVNRRTTRNALVKRTPARAHLFNCCVDIGYEARDTVGNATETRQWATDNKFTSLIVVTSSYHMPRSLAELHQVLPKATLYPYPVISRSVHAEAWYANPGTAKLLLWEYMKFLPAATRYGAARLFGSNREQSALRAGALTSS